MMPYEGLVIDYNQDDWGQITLDSHLGGGAYGDVFYGVEVSSGREVTVKVIRNVESDLEEYRVKNEAAIDVESDYIVPVVSSKKEDATTWIILFKYYKAQPLDAIIEESVGESVPHYKHYTEQLILALHAAHSNNIIHRDIKPGNILISDHSAATPGSLRVIDFGVSKLRAGESMTIPGVPVGTRPYMCPTVFLDGGKDATFSADIFSFGITVAEMVYGKHPWRFDFKTIAENVKFQLESGQNSMVNIDHINAKDSSFTSLVEKSTAIETSGRIRQWSEIAKLIGLELDLEDLGDVAFNGQCHLMNLSGINEGGVIPIKLDEGEELVLGRDKISITNKRISRKHITLKFEDEKLLIEDMGSKNGTWLDGEKLQAGDSAEAFSGSKLRVEDMFIEIVFR